MTPACWRASTFCERERRVSSVHGFVRARLESDQFSPGDNSPHARSQMSLPVVSSRARRPFARKQRGASGTAQRPATLFWNSPFFPLRKKEETRKNQRKSSSIVNSRAKSLPCFSNFRRFSANRVRRLRAHFKGETELVSISLPLFRFARGLSPRALVPRYLQELSTNCYARGGMNVAGGCRQGRLEEKEENA